MKARNVELALDHIGHRSTVKIDGEDVSNMLAGVTVRTYVGGVTEVTLEAVCLDVTAYGDATVKWHVPPVIATALEAAADAARNPLSKEAHEAMFDALQQIGWVG